MPAEALAASSQLHKQLLAQEVVKLRREVATLRAASSTPAVEEDDEIRSPAARACTLAARWGLRPGALTAVRARAHQAPETGDAKPGNAKAVHHCADQCAKGAPGQGDQEPAGRDRKGSEGLGGLCGGGVGRAAAHVRLRLLHGRAC